MAKVIGFKPTVFDFTDKTGKKVHSEGFTLYLTYTSKSTEGLACESCYLSNEKLNGYVPYLDEEIEVLYNKFGKASGIRLIST